MSSISFIASAKFAREIEQVRQSDISRHSPPDDYFSFGHLSPVKNSEAQAARDWLLNTPIPKPATEKPQPSDFIVFSIKGEALGKTCEKFGDFEKPSFSGSLSGKFKSDFAASGSTLKDFLEYDEKKRKREQKRIKPTIKAANDFSVIRDMQKLQSSKKFKRIEDLKLLDFNGTDFNQVTQIAPNLKLSDFAYTEFKQVRAIDEKTGEIFTFNVKGKGNKRKYILQASMSQLDDRLSLQKVMAKLLPEYRVSKCLCCVQDKHKPLTVFKSVKHGTISVSNLQTCGSVWHDPFCAAKITEKRRAEINEAVEKHKADGGSISLVTRTVPHTAKDSLLSLRDRFRKADAYMKENYRYKKMRPRFGTKGDIKTYEMTVTWLNGWHLHIHEVFFHNQDAFEGVALESNPAYVAFLKDFEQTYYDIWRDCSTKAGFDEPSREHGLQVQNGDFAAEYIAKWGHEPESNWGVDSELTKAHIKNSKKGFTPWELMRLYRDTEDERLVPIIQEYAHTMHGSQQIIWSKGLKKAFGIGEKSDDELANELDDVAEELGVLSPVQWKFIVKHDLRSEFFYFVGQGFDVLTDFLHSFDKYPKIFSLAPSPEKS